MLNKLIVKDFKIDFTFLNVVNKKNLQKRLASRSKLNRYDSFNFNFYNRVQKGYLKISNKSKNYKIINSNKDRDFNKKIIQNKISQLLQI